jgi:hypothetical protein
VVSYTTHDVSNLEHRCYWGGIGKQLVGGRTPFSGGTIEGC